MQPSMAQDMQAQLCLIEHDTTLRLETNFVARASALDTVEFHILNRIENVLYEHGYREELALLHGRAAQLWRRLEAVNERLFCRLRRGIRSGAYDASALRQLFDTYVGPESQGRHRDPIGYDDLDAFVDGLLGITGEPEETRDLVSGMIGYQATPARFILALLDHLHLEASDVFYDLGSGLGRVVLLVGLLSAAQVKGIEYEPAYCAYAQQRARCLHLSRVSVLNVDARQADYTDGTVFFMYTPFTGHMLQAVLERLRAAACVRPITLVTYGPCTQPVAQQEWLQRAADQVWEDRDLVIFIGRGKASHGRAT